MTSTGAYAFRYCSTLTELTFPLLSTAGNYSFQGCGSLERADFHVLPAIGLNVFNVCSSLEALILRSDSVVTLQSLNSFTGTPIAGGTGYVYVPAALVDSYKAATNWSTYANQFRAIEAYPEVTG